MLASGKIILDKPHRIGYNIICKELISMQNVTTEKALKNQLASVSMEGFRFSAKEIDNVKKCLSGELTFQQFKEKLVGGTSRK